MVASHGVFIEVVGRMLCSPALCSLIAALPSLLPAPCSLLSAPSSLLPPSAPSCLILRLSSVMVCDSLLNSVSLPPLSFLTV